MTVVADPETDPSEPGDPEAERVDDDLEPLIGGRTVDLGRALLAGFVAMFFAGAVVFAWQQWTNEPHPNDVDIGFADDMRTHHLQGVTLSLAYLEDGTDPYFRSTAVEIIIVQAGESRLMGQWLVDWGNPDLDLDNAMAWMGMAPVPQSEQPGMATEAEVAELEAAEGAELDDLFSSLMINHHRGGQHMAQYAVDHGSEEVVTDLAQAIVTTQRSEVAEMNIRREELGLPPV